MREYETLLEFHDYYFGDGGLTPEQKIANMAKMHMNYILTTEQNDIFPLQDIE